MHLEEGSTIYLSSQLEAGAIIAHDLIPPFLCIAAATLRTPDASPDQSTIGALVAARAGEAV